MVHVLPAPPTSADTALSNSLKTRSPSEVVYELCPPDALPTLDLSLSIKSRFLGQRALARFNTLVRRRNLIGIAACIGIVCYLLALLLPAKLGRVLGVLSGLLYMPNVIAGFSLLRSDVCRLLPRSYDFYFTSFVNASTFLVLVLLMGDTRGIAILAAGLGVQNNILIDASIRAVKLWVVFNVCGTLSFAITWGVVAFDLVDEIEHRVLVRLHGHELTAKGYVTAGLVTLTAIVARNVYRKRHVFRKHESGATVECVSYRTNLKYVVRSSSSSNSTSTTRQVGPCSSAWQSTVTTATHTPEFIKTMRHVRPFKAVDARDTLLRAAWVRQTVCQSSTHAALFYWFGITSAMATGVASIAFVCTFGSRRSIATQVSGIVALVLTVLYCGMFMLHTQRQILKALCSSFDFVFLSVQASVIHASLCDLLLWRSGCSIIVASWIWSHWVLVLDATTPVMRAKLGLQSKTFPVVLLSILVVVNVQLIWKLLVSDALNPMYDRILWSGEIGGHRLEFPLIPVFVNCVATVFLLSIRLLWRLVHNDVDVLLVLDGAVAYENYLVTATCRRSRRKGSIVSTTCVNTTEVLRVVPPS